MNSFTSSSSTTDKPSTAALASKAADPAGVGRYLLVMGLVLAIGLGFSWLWSATMKLAFLDPEYAAWSAKQDLVARCDLGDLLVLGDSRAGAGMMPTRLPGNGINISVGGAKPVEMYFFLRRAMACPNMPHHVLLSIDAGHFHSTDTFWERSARFGTFSVADLHEIEAVARKTGDESLFDQPRADGLPNLVRDVLYATSFPTLNFASMVRGGLFLRYAHNVEERSKTLRARGHHLFGDADGDSAEADDASLDSFQVLPLEGWYFERMLQEMQARGIRVDFVTVPVNEATARHITPQLRKGFTEYLAAAASKYPNFHVLVAPIPSMPDRYFGDVFAHLNQGGAERFSASLAAALRREHP
ncbi:hypothetical protein [Lichenicoccus sp.]|uniref:hypothetical protein n=1 Tax=Lichenicoccus sp. TaxID=2781899 RepID=UPI003D0C7759